MCKSPKIVYSQILPCGKCEECLKRKRITEYNRLKYAFKGYGRAFHLTLTYDNEHVETACFSHVNSFINKLRERFACEYYCVKEFGDVHGRIHFHLILFVDNGVPNSDVLGRIKLWTKGFTKIRVCYNASGFRYLTDYLFKSYGGVDNTGRNFTCSRDLGYKEFLKIHDLTKPSTAYVGSWSYLPRCWKDKYLKSMFEYETSYFYYSGLMNRIVKRFGNNLVIPVSVVVNKHYTYSSGDCESSLIAVSRECMSRLKARILEDKFSFHKTCVAIKFVIPYFGRYMPQWLIDHFDKFYNEQCNDLHVDVVLQYVDFNVPCCEYFDCYGDILKQLLQEWEIEKYGNRMIDGFNILI